MKQLIIVLIYLMTFCTLISIWNHQLGWAVLDALCLLLNFHNLKRHEAMEDTNALP